MTDYDVVDGSPLYGEPFFNVSFMKGCGNMIYRGLALSVAGSDSGGGAGIQADLKTFAALKVFGMNVVTALTAQNSLTVSGIQDTSVEMVKLQFDALFGDFQIDAVKTGMLSRAATISAVADALRRYEVSKIVVDPVMVAQSGSSLISSDATGAFLTELIPLALLVTPNIPEAEILGGIKIDGLEDMKKAAVLIAQRGCKAVLVKGGHLIRGTRVFDVLYLDGEFCIFEDEKIETENTHGTGCTLSSAVTAELAAGRDLRSAVDYGRRYLRLALTQSFRPGHSYGPLGHAVSVPWI